MKPKREEKTAFARWVRPIVVGSVAGALVCFFLLLLMATVIISKDIPKTAVTPMAVCAAAAGSFVAGLLSAAMKRANGWLCGALCGAALFVLVMLAGWVLLQQVRGATLLLKAAIMTGCGCIGGMLGVHLHRK